MSYPSGMWRNRAFWLYSIALLILLLDLGFGLAKGQPNRRFELLGIIAGLVFFVTTTRARRKV